MGPRRRRSTTPSSASHNDAVPPPRPSGAAAAVERPPASRKDATPGGLRDRELRALKPDFERSRTVERRATTANASATPTIDLSDCAEIKLSAIPETRGNPELGPSHRLLYREFEAEDNGPPYREIVAFERRKDDRPFHIAAARLNRPLGMRLDRLHRTTGPQTHPAANEAAPIRQRLPPDLRKALAAASDVVPARGAVTSNPSPQTTAATRQHPDPPSRDR